MKKTVLVFIASLALAVLQMAALPGAAAQTGKFKYSVDKIWDEGTHAAFTGLVEFKGKYYCTFREGYSHIFDEEGNAEGRIRVLESSNGKAWKSVLDAGIEGIDCRDPKLCVTPDGRLMVLFGGSTYRNRKLVAQQGYVIFSRDGKTFTEPEKISFSPEVPNASNWLWRVTWNGDTGYGVSYGAIPGASTLVLYQTRDGVRYEKVKSIDELADTGNETTLRFLPDGRMLMMVRRDRGDRMGYWGEAMPPYTDWKFSRMPLVVGGQDFVVLDDGTVLAGTRSYHIGSHCKTVILRGTVGGDFQEVFTLPSNGDTSYPGLLVVGKELWVSYYSSIEKPGKAAIFLAKIPLAALMPAGGVRSRP
ncbi:MAG: exo-alpha-sialidase [Bacteroidales bacterium]|nr:exo-alpha-sialidase [Bacteroidales bacterium]